MPIQETKFMLEFHHHRFKYPPPPRFLVVVGFVWSDAPESYTSSSIAAGRASNARQVNQTTTVFNL